MKRAGTRHFDHVAAPLSFGAVQLDIGAAPAHAAPGGQRQVLHAAHADVAKHRNALLLHEQVVGRLGPAELAEAGALPGVRLVPVHAARYVMHGLVSLSYFAHAPAVARMSEAICGANPRP